MARIEETPLPGVGLRHEFTSEDGNRIGVIRHRTGRRELFVRTAEDPDAVMVSLSLSEDDSQLLSDVLGGSTVERNLRDLQQQIEGLAIDWLKIERGTPYATGTIGDARIRTRTGVSVVAVIRGEQGNPAPGPDFRLQPKDTLVVVGTAEGIKELEEILATG